METTDKNSLGIKQLRVTDDLSEILGVLPPAVKKRIDEQENADDLIEIVMDLGREPEIRFPEETVRFSDMTVTADDIDYTVERIGSFGKDNRAGIERTLHRISGIRNRQGRLIGLTCRIGRAVYGTIDMIRDVVESGVSILMLGRPGIGKTTKLREVARILADELQKRVVVVDTSNEIAGDGDIPHPAIGHARRMQVVSPELQHSVMIEAVENHMPQAIIIDEIGTEQEALAARSIAERGVQLVATAHGNSLENLMMNPTLSDLVGGIQTVTLSDEEAKRRGTLKSVLERKAPPTFDVLIEITDIDKLAIHMDVAGTVDKILRGEAPRPEIRVRNLEGEINVVQPGDIAERPALQRTPIFEQQQHSEKKPQRPQIVKILPYGVSRNRLEKAIRELRVPAYISKDISDSDYVVTLKTHERKNLPMLNEAHSRNLPVYSIKSNTYAQIASVMREIFNMGPASDEEEALREVDEAIQSVLETGEAQELQPQSSFIRRLQHQMSERYDLKSESVGTEPYRRVRVFRS